MITTIDKKKKGLVKFAIALCAALLSAALRTEIVRGFFLVESNDDESTEESDEYNETILHRFNTWSLILVGISFYIFNEMALEATAPPHTERTSFFPYTESDYKDKKDESAAEEQDHESSKESSKESSTNKATTTTIIEKKEQLTKISTGEPATIVQIPEGVTTIGKRAYSDSKTLTRIEFPASLQSIQDEAFCNCTQLESLVFRSSSSNDTTNTAPQLKTIGKSAFLGCTKLTKIELPSSLVTIGSLAFCDCTQLQSVKLQKGLQTIGNNTFRNCTNLTDLELPPGCNIEF